MGESKYRTTSLLGLFNSEIRPHADRYCVDGQQSASAVAGAGCSSLNHSNGNATDVISFVAKPALTNYNAIDKNG